MTGRTEQTRREFMDALERLRIAVATPQKIRLRNPALDRRRQIGTLRVSVLSVSQEAGKSRTLIGQDGGAYQDVRDAILKAIGPKEKGKTQRQEIDELRAKIAALKQQVRARDSRNCELIDRMEDMRVQAKLSVQEAERVAARPAGIEDQDDEGDGEDDDA